MTDRTQERLRSAIMAIMQDGRDRTIGDLARAIDASEEDLRIALRRLLATRKLAVDYNDRIPIYQIASKHRKAA